MLFLINKTNYFPAPVKLSLEGKVVQRAECRPINDKNYMILKQDAIRRAIKPKNTTISIKAPVNAYKPISNHASNVSIDSKIQLNQYKTLHIFFN